MSTDIVIWLEPNSLPYRRVTVTSPSYSQSEPSGTDVNDVLTNGVTVSWLIDISGRIMVRLVRCLFLWRRNLMMIGVFSLAIYIIFFDPSTQVNIPDGAIDLEELEREVDIGRPVRLVTYRSPLNNKLYAVPVVNRSQYGNVHKFEANISKRFRYNRIWLWAHDVVSHSELFPETDEVDHVLSALHTAPIVHVENLNKLDYESGTSEKWVVTLDGGQKAMMKIVWEDKGGMKDGALCNFGYEMPHGEIAGFHLHRLLGFRNTPYVSGRVVDLQREILPVASPDVVKQITTSSGINETCVTGKCYFCKKKLRLCPHNNQLEVSLAYWIPRKLLLYTYPPEYMPYSTPSMPEWGQMGFNNRSYCNKVRQTEPYDQNYYYYDLFDFAVLDTLMYHFDSKHYAIDDRRISRRLTVRLDHGRAFCAYDRDDEQIFMAPLIQCCTLRRSTYNKLVKHRGILGAELRQSLALDPIHPVLVPEWYPVLDRRLKLILANMEKCAQENGGWDNVLVDG